MRVLVACEESGRVRDCFRDKGHDAISLDLLPTSSPGPHRQEPLTPEVLSEGWDLIVAFPPCTDLSAIGASSWKTKQADGRQQRAFEFVKMIWDAPVSKIAIENPVGWLNSHWRKPDQIIHPWQFGDPYTKRTCLWLKGLPKLVPSVTIKPEEPIPWVTGQRIRLPDGSLGVDPKDKGSSRRGSSESVKALRSKTFRGIAQAMAKEWC